MLSYVVLLGWESVGFGDLRRGEGRL